MPTQPGETTAAAAPRKKWRVIVASVLLLSFAVAGLVGFVTQGFDRGGWSAASSTPSPSSTESTPSPLEVPAPTPGPIGDEKAADEAVSTTVASLLVATNQVLQRGDGSIDGAEVFADGFVLGELQALAVERREMGYRQVGDATVTEVTVVSTDLTSDPPSVVVSVCIDTSAIDVLDENGASLKDQLYTPGHPVEHTYGARFVDGLWKITTHEIPDEGTCT